MSLNVSRIVGVDISVSPLALQRAGFGILNIIGISSNIPMNERIREYNSITDVAADFATTDEEYLAASEFFSQVPRPSVLYISRRANAAFAAQLFGSSNISTTLSAWTGITAGKFDVTIDGSVEHVTGLNFSAATTMANVASIIDTAFAGGTCAYDSDNTRLVLTSGTTGANSSITFATAPSSGVDVSELAGFQSTQGGDIMQGGAAETIAESLNLIETINSKWYGFAFTKEVRDGSITSGGTGKDAINAAVWAEARVKLFCNNSTDANSLITGNTSTIAYELQAAGYSRTFTVYNAGSYPAVSVFARGATVDFNGENTTITYKFKQLPGITATDLSATQASALTTINCNYYARFGTQLSGDAVALLAEGVVANGRFLDEIVGIDWLQNAIQTDVFNFLYQSTTKIPQTDEGVAGICQKVEGVLANAVRNGLAAPGTVTIDSANTFLPKGYLVIAGKTEDQNQADREARKAPPISFIVKGAGAIHSVTITGTFVR